MPEFLVELSGYFATGWVAVLETVMIFFMVFWILWCTKLYLEPDDGLEPIPNEKSEIEING